MNTKELANSLKQLKNLKGAGAAREEFLKRNREILLMQINNSTEQRKADFSLKYMWRAFESVMPNTAFNFVFKPALTAVIVFGIVFGGWAATVSASYNSLPGDTLYSVKRMTEKAQVSFAPKEGKVSLRTEFAARRLEEMRKILEAPYMEEREEKTKQVVQSFHNEIKAVKITLENMGGRESGEKAVEAAKIVDRKTGEYSTVLQEAKNSVSEEVKIAVERAADVVNDAGIKAIEVIIKSAPDLANVDQAVINKVEEKIKIVEDKVNEIREEGASGAEGATKEAEEVLDAAREAFGNNDLTTVVDKLVEAKNLMNTAIQPPAAGNSSASGTLQTSATSTPGILNNITVTTTAEKATTSTKE